MQMKGSIGVKESDINVSWLDPYFNDSLWRFGIDLQYNTSTILTTNYRLNTLGTVLNATYPVSSYFN